jgi:hypothetical protein
MDDLAHFFICQNQVLSRLVEDKKLQKRVLRLKIAQKAFSAAKDKNQLKIWSSGKHIFTSS